MGRELDLCNGCGKRSKKCQCCPCNDDCSDSDSCDSDSYGDLCAPGGGLRYGIGLATYMTNGPLFFGPLGYGLGGWGWGGLYGGW